MKILFLDIDGVCNSEASFRKNSNTHFPTDAYMCFLVGKIALDTGCQVVLSSSWRHHKDSVKYINDRVVSILDCTGNEPYDPSLPDGIGNCQRGREIKAWLDKYKVRQIIEKYAILDDSGDMLPEQLPNFFKTDWKIGLTEEIAQKVIKHLNS